MKQIKKSYGIILAVFAVIFTGFLLYQVNDEMYYGVNELTDVAKEADTSEGTIILPADFKGTYAKTPVLGLNAGSYTMEIDHQGEADSEVVVYNNEAVLESFTLPGDELLSTFQFDLSEPSDCIEIQFTADAKGAFTFKHVNFSAQKAFYSDTIFGVIFIIVLLLLGMLYYRKQDFVRKSDEGKLAVFTAVFTLLLVCYPLFNDFLNYSHDVEFHLMRIQGIADGLRGGQFPVQIYPGNMKNHGYLGSLYPSLFLYIPAVLRLLGVSMVTAYKFLIFLMQAGTMAFTYYAAKEMTKSDQIAVTAMVLYALAPYRLMNIYIRGALGESLAMMFLPLIIVGIFFVVAGNPKKWYVLALGLSGVVEAHVLSGLLISVFCVLFVLLYTKRLFAEKRILPLIKALVMTIVLNLGFLVPFVYYLPSKLKMSTLSMFGFYEMSDFPSQLFMTGATMEDAEALKSGISNEMVTGIGIIGIAGIAISLLYFVLKKEKNEEENRMMKFFMVMELLYLYAATSWFPWQTLQKFSLINKIVLMVQFPWRTLGIAAVLGALVTAIALYRCEILKKNCRVVCLFLAVLCLMSACPIMEAYLSQDVKYTKVTGEMGDAPHGEYAPETANLDELTWADEPEFDSSSMTLSSYNKKASTITFSYSSKEDSSVVVLPMFYYKGFAAKNGLGNAIGISQSNDGRIAVSLPAGEEQGITVSYQPPIWFLLAAIVSIMGLIGIFASFFKEKHKN